MLPTRDAESANDEKILARAGHGDATADVSRGAGCNSVGPDIVMEGAMESQPQLVNGQTVASIVLVPWRELDQHLLFDGARIVGRATVAIGNGGQANGLVVKRSRWDAASARAVDVTYVVVWERDGSPAGVFRALALDGK